MSRIFVFAGPSLSAARRRADPHFVWHDPAAAGDLIALLDDPPERLCLIDGYFDSCAAPWHKELLLLMAAGTVLFGASSMGALRAAELDGLGMIGVGAIYRAYRDGRLTGDDEVALIHAPARLDWAPLTVPLVEVRATLLAAVRAQILVPAVARRVRDIARGIHFEDRDWPMLREACMTAGITDPETFDRVAAMHVRLKEQDALACLAAAQTASSPGVVMAAPPATWFIKALARQRLPAEHVIEALDPRLRRSVRRCCPPEDGDA